MDGAINTTTLNIMQYFLSCGLIIMLAATSHALFSKSSRGLVGFASQRPVFRSLLASLTPAQSFSSAPMPSTDLKFSSLRTVNFKAQSDVASFNGDVLIVPLFQGHAKKPVLKLLNGETFTHPVVADLIADHSFKAEAGAECLVRVYNHDSLNVKYVALVGLGAEPKKDGEVSKNTPSRLASAIVSVAEKTQAKHVGLVVPTGVAQEHVANLMLSVHDALYKDERFRLPSKKPENNKPPGGPLATVSLFEIEAAVAKALPETQRSVEHIVSGVNFAKDLVGAPSNSKTPLAIAQAAKELAASLNLECNVLGLEECQRLNMGGYLGVQQGSKFPPQFVHLVYRPKTPHRDGVTKVALVGKGLTFDSGGYNLKTGPGSSIELMKFDMGGCGAVLGAAKAIGQLQPDHVEVHFISAVCENMVSAEAVRPGDILVASNGKTIEVLNTDAEGRLTLADALVYAQRLGVDHIVDLATLTGACIVGLGDHVAGLYANNAALRTALESSASRSGDKVWSMPLTESYREWLKSPIADLKNISGGKGGGSITAALFLQEFVEVTGGSNDADNCSPAWAHIDMAGPVWDNAKSRPTGYGVRLLVDYLQHLQKKN